MHSSFFYLFLGLLFQLDFYAYKGIDIIPDVVGYYLIYKGLREITNESKYFALADKLILPVLALSVVKIYNFQYHPDFFLSFSFAIDIVKAILFTASMYLVYNLCKGSMEVAESIQDDYLERTINQRLYLYLGVAGVLLLLSVFSLLPFGGIIANLQGFFTIIYFAYIFVIIILAAGIYGLYKELSPTKGKRAKVKAKVTVKQSQAKRKR
ncbi:MAG: hypothetical protein ACOX3R_08865 [Desulfitobacteriia bacterium]|jgi:hypothetical protein